MDNNGLLRVAATEDKDIVQSLNQKLQNKVDEYAMLMESTGVCIVKFNLDENLSIYWCNDAMYQSIDYSKEEFSTLFHNNMRSYYQKEYEEDFLTLVMAIKQALKGGKKRFEVLLRQPKRQGFIWIKGVGTFTDFDATTGKPATLYGVYTDVTEIMTLQNRLTYTEKALQETFLLKSENERLTRILDNVPSGIAVCTVKNKRPVQITINHHLAASLNLPQGLLQLRSMDHLLSIVHPDDRSAARTMLLRCLATKEPMHFLCRLKRHNSDDYRWIRITGNLVSQEDHTSVAYFSYTDVTEIKEAEAALRDSRRMYKEIIKASKLSIWEYDILKEQITMADDEYTKADIQRFNLPKTISAVPASLEAYIEPDDWPAMLHTYDEVRSGHDSSCEVWYRMKSGQEPRCERITYTTICDDKGRAVRAYGVGQNITAEKRIDERYQREIKYLQQNGGNDLIATSHCSLTKNKMLNYAPNDTVRSFSMPLNRNYDKACQEFLQIAYEGTDRQRLAAHIDRQNLIQRYRQGETFTRLEYRRLVPGKAPFWVSTEIHTFQVPGSGDLEALFYTYDINTKALEEQIIAKLKIIDYEELGLIYITSGFWECYRLRGPSDAAALWESNGTYHDEVERFVQDDVIPEERERVRQLLQIDHIVQGLAKKELYYFVTTTAKEDGCFYKTRFQMVYQDENKDAIFYCISDITESVQHEQEQIAQLQAAKLEAERANEAKSAFLASMSHDLRTPLNGVMGFTEIALREQNSHKKQELLHKIKSSGDLLLDLINDTLELSRIESGKMILEPEVTDSKDIGETVVTALRPSAELKGIELKADVARFPSGSIWVDKLKLQKVILNLLSNAIKYTPHGGTVALSIEILSPPLHRCNRRIIVEDTGIGMSPEFLEHLYEPFSQEHRPEASAVTGTGLGLSIVKKIVDIMGGTIRVESHIGQGTRFTVDLPILSTNRGRAEKRANQALLKSLAGKQILLCEDNYLNAEIAAILLQEKDMKVDIAENGQAGVALFSASKPGYYAAILMDIRMPIMDGYAAAQAIRGLVRPDAASIPIIAMTADAFAEDVRQAYAAGMNGYITKPVDTNKLMELLQTNIK